MASPMDPEPQVGNLHHKNQTLNPPDDKHTHYDPISSVRVDFGATFDMFCETQPCHLGAVLVLSF